MADVYNLTDLQGDIGINNDQSVFTDAEIERLWTRSSEVHNLTVYYAIRQILASSTLFIDYSSGLTSEKRSQVWQHLKEKLQLWRDEAFDVESQVEVMGLTSVPYRKKDKPWRNRNAKYQVLNEYIGEYEEEF